MRIALASPKGGVGKSTLSMHVGHRLQLPCLLAEESERPGAIGVWDLPAAPARLLCAELAPWRPHIVLVPVEPDFEAWPAALDLVDALPSARVIVNKFQRRLAHDRQFLEALRGEYGGLSLQTVVPYSNRLRRARSLGLTLFEYAPYDRTCVALNSMCREVKRIATAQPEGQSREAQTIHA